MKYISTLLLLAFCSSLTATAREGRDSVAFFYRPEKVVVLINERSSSGRLIQFMEQFTFESKLVGASNDGTITFSCSRNSIEAGCRFRFLPSANVAINNRRLKTSIASEELGLSPAGTFKMNFASSMKDRFQLVIDDEGIMTIEGSKILGNLFSQE